MDRAPQSVGVVTSEATRRAHVEEARRSGALYRFRGADGVVHWLKGPYACLAPNGAMSLLRRSGIPARYVSEPELVSDAIEAYGVLILPEATALLPEASRGVERWIQRGDRRLVVSGATTLPERLLGVRRLGTVVPDDYVGVDLFGDGAVPVSCPEYEIQAVEPVGGARGVGSLVQIRRGGGTEWREHALGLPAMVTTDRTLFLSFPFFGYVGGALQGQVSIEPIRPYLGAARLFYLDALARWFATLVERHLPSNHWRVRLLPWGRSPSAVVYRHDTDHSADPTYLEYEVTHRLAATYAVLPDRNCKFWISQLASHPSLEASYHYRTHREGRLFRLLHRPRTDLVPEPRAITRRGLIGQARLARRRRIPIVTVHRHGPFFYYPESIDALDALYRCCGDVEGSGSMFRGSLFRFHSSPESEAFTVLTPDTSVPFWAPFRLVMAAVERHAWLRGWESTQLIEPDPATLDALFRYADAHPGGAYVLGYHPAHARRPTFNPRGNFEWFTDSVREARGRGWWVTTVRELYRRMTDWEALTLGATEHCARVRNGGPRPYRDLVVRTPGGDRALGDLAPGAEALVEW